MHFTNIARKYENVKLWMKTIFQCMYIFCLFCWMNFSLFCPVPRSSSPKLLSLSSALLTIMASVSSNSQFQFLYTFLLRTISSIPAFSRVLHAVCLLNHSKYLDSGLHLSSTHISSPRTYAYSTPSEASFAVYDKTPLPLKSRLT